MLDIPEIKLIVGLGNVGKKYENTRHNLGYDLLLNIAEKYHVTLESQTRFFGMTGRGDIEEQDLRLLFPTTYMNESGKAVGAICSFYRIDPTQVLVLHDELDLPAGALRFKFGGGLAGHNGLRSIARHLGGRHDFYRLRIGIGKTHRSATIDYVLSSPPPGDREAIGAALEGAMTGLRMLLREGAARATSYINSFK